MEETTNDAGFDSDSIERQLVRSLWRWSEAAPSGLTFASATADVAEMMGWFLNGIFRESPNAHSWWTDGVIELKLSQPTPTSINSVGAVIWAGFGPKFYLAPLEFEFYFASSNAAECERVIVRFGKLDRNRTIVRLKYDSSASGVIRSRPTTNRDWAPAVELE